MKVQCPSDKITVFESALYRTNSTLIEREHDLVLVDPNWLPVEIDFIRDYILQHFPEKPLSLYFTHADFDHILGYGAFPQAQTLADIHFVNFPDKEQAILQIREFDDQYYIRRHYPLTFPDIDIRIDTTPFRWTVNQATTIFYWTPGHVNHGSAAVFEKERLCIAGDYVSNIEIPWIEYDFNAYKTTLLQFQQILDNHPVDILVPGHGDAAIGIENIKQRLSLDWEYVDAFLHNFYPENPIFESVIQKKGHMHQNRIIHQKNVDFFLKQTPST